MTWEQVTAIAGGGVVGRPHIARAHGRGRGVGDPGDAFSPDWIGAGGRAYVTRYALDPARADRAGPGRGRGRRCWPTRAARAAAGGSPTR